MIITSITLLIPTVPKEGVGFKSFSGTKPLLPSPGPFDGYLHERRKFIRFSTLGPPTRLESITTYVALVIKAFNVWTDICIILIEVYGL